MALIVQSSSRATDYVVTAANWNETMFNVNFLGGAEGNVTLSSGAALTVPGALVASSSVSIAGGLLVTGTADITTLHAYAGGISVTGSLEAASSASVAGSLVVTKSVVMSSSASVGGDLLVTGALDVTTINAYAGGIGVTGSLVASSSASVGGDLTANNLRTEGTVYCGVIEATGYVSLTALTTANGGVYGRLFFARSTTGAGASTSGYILMFSSS